MTGRYLWAVTNIPASRPSLVPDDFVEIPNTANTEMVGRAARIAKISNTLTSVYPAQRPSSVADNSVLNRT